MRYITVQNSRISSHETIWNEYRSRDDRRAEVTELGKAKAAMRPDASFDVIVTRHAVRWFWTDNLDGTDPPLAARDTAFVAVSTAAIQRLLDDNARMGWRFGWASRGQSRLEPRAWRAPEPVNAATLTGSTRAAACP